MTGRPQPRWWARHYQDVWQLRAGNRNLPAYFRVACLAYGSHHANGHANFGRGDVAAFLGHPDEDGVLVPMDRRHVQRTIQQAIEYELLAPGSTSLCLVVPAHAIEGGQGQATSPCPVHARRAAGRSRKGPTPRSVSK